jgi:putative metallohydrolase (TIGR04338 family)
MYQAEHEALSRWGRRFSGVAEARSYLDRLVGSEWFFEHWPNLQGVEVQRRGPGARWSCSYGEVFEEALAVRGVIRLAVLDQATVLHELAHLCCPQPSGHDTGFAETLLTLVRREMGFGAFAELYQALRQREGFAHVRPGIQPD